MKEKIRKLMDTLRNDPRAKGMVQGMKQPENDAEAAEAYAKLAQDLGFDISAEEIAEAMKKMEQAQQARTGAAAEAVEKASLTEGDLDRVAGGNSHPTVCEDSFTEGEWCWFTDSCSFLINSDYITETSQVFGDSSDDDGWARMPGDIEPVADPDTIHKIMYDYDPLQGFLYDEIPGD